VSNIRTCMNGMVAFTSHQFCIIHSQVKKGVGIEGVTSRVPKPVAHPLWSMHTAACGM
jgi:hypothetical protein